MAIQMRPDYVNPLTTMTDKKTAPKLNQPVFRQGRQSDRVTELQTKQQSLQNHMLLPKATGTDSAGAAAETQKLVEDELEKVTAELRSAKGSYAQSAEPKPVRDLYKPEKTVAASPGFYRLEKDEKQGYRIFFSPYSKD